MKNIEQTPQFGTKEFNDLASSYFGGKPKQSIENKNTIDDKEIKDLIFQTINGIFGVIATDEHDQVDGYFDTYEEALDFIKKKYNYEK